MACEVCNDSGWVEVPDSSGEHAYDTDCPNCDGPDEDKEESYIAWRYPTAMTEIETY